MIPLSRSCNHQSYLRDQTYSPRGASSASVNVAAGLVPNSRADFCFTLGRVAGRRPRADLGGCCAHIAFWLLAGRTGITRLDLGDGVARLCRRLTDPSRSALRHRSRLCTVGRCPLLFRIPPTAPTWCSYSSALYHLVDDPVRIATRRSPKRCACCV